MPSLGNIEVPGRLSAQDKNNIFLKLGGNWAKC